MIALGRPTVQLLTYRSRCGSGLSRFQQGGAHSMSTAQRVNRGFHRLARFLAAITLLLGRSLSVYIAFDLANRLWEQHQKLVCAHEHVAGKKPGENVFDQSDTVKLKQIGCSNSDD